MDSTLPRLRQAVVAAADLDAVAGELRHRLGLADPYSDPGVEYFGLRNAVFPLGDTFLEVVSPIRPDTAAGRLIERRGGDCGYMLMFQVEDLAAARTRAVQLGIREVFAVELDNMAEMHLHPSDMRGAIVSLSEPHPPDSWRWGGPDWESRNAPQAVVGAAVEVPSPAEISARWESVLGQAPALLDISLRPGERGLVEIIVAGLDAGFELAGVRFTASDYEEE